MTEVSDEMVEAALFQYEDVTSGIGWSAKKRMRQALEAALAARPSPVDEPVAWSREAPVASYRFDVDGYYDTPHADALRDATSTIAALVAERDEARERTNAAVEDYNDALAALATANARITKMEKALAGLLNAETHLMHDGYDDGPGGGDYVYVNVIRTDDEAFTRASAALTGGEDDN
jgi:hypothetical protein